MDPAQLGYGTKVALSRRVWCNNHMTTDTKAAGPTPPYLALTIAKWFVAWAEANEAELSNLKLQKLLYYAQGYHLALRNVALFMEPIQAKPLGPVVEKVYQAFKQHGSGDLSLPKEDEFDWPDVDEETTQFLIQIWDKLGSLAAWRLRDMVHSEAPWKEHFTVDPRRAEIPQSTMARFFKPLTVPVAV